MKGSKPLHGSEQNDLIFQKSCFILSGTSLSVSCGLCREGTDAYTFIDHVDNHAWHCRVDHWWGGNASVLSAKRRRAVSPWRFNRIYPRSDFGSLSLAQIPVARTTRLNLESARALACCH
jgi:hypothetical protein